MLQLIYKRSGSKIGKRGCARMEKKDKLQEIRMCFQTYINLYGVAPDVLKLLEWLGASYKDMIPEYMRLRTMAS